MWGFMRLAFAASISLLLYCTGALAQQSRDAENTDRVLQMPDRIIREIALEPDKFLQDALSRLYRINPDGSATKNSEKERASIDLAQRRAQLFAQVMRLDLNGDFHIQLDEANLARKFSLSGREKITTLLIFEQADQNKDSSVSFEEIKAYINAELKQYRERNTRSNKFDFMDFDLNGDGQATVEEIVEIVGSIKGAGHIRIEPIRGKRPRPASKLNPTCKLPQPSGNAEIVLVGAYEGYAISNVAITDLNEVTTAGILHIEAGAKPLYIIALGSEAIVWKLEGATSRVERFVGAIGRTGVSGIAKSRVSFVLERDCLPDAFSKTSDRKARIAKTHFEAQFKRDVDRIAATYKISRLILPSGKNIAGASDRGRFMPTKHGLARLNGAEKQLGAGPMGDLRRSLLRFSPGGVMKLSAKAVIASPQARPYDVLPQQAGLIQLVEEGKLSMLSERDFRIPSPIVRFPAGLSGAHSVRFRLAKGVPHPAGDPGHSKVTAE